MEKIDFICNEIKKSKSLKKGFLYKNFFNDLPKWNDFINCIFEETQKDATFASFNPDAQEVPYGNVLIIDGYYFAPQISDWKKYFPQVTDMISLMISKNMNIAFAGPKATLGPRLVTEHQDVWDGLAVQCEGSTTWILRCKEMSYEEIFYLEPGDILYFPQECTHEVISDVPRANLIFNLPL